MAEHLRWPEVKAEGGFIYAEVFSVSSRALDKLDATDFEKLSSINSMATKLEYLDRNKLIKKRIDSCKRSL